MSESWNESNWRENLNQLFDAQAARIAALEAASLHESWHKGFCTPTCAPGHHVSGCYERMINDAKKKIAALVKAAETALIHLSQLGRSPTHSTPYVIQELRDALAHPEVQRAVKKTP